MFLYQFGRHQTILKIKYREHKWGRNEYSECCIINKGKGKAQIKAGIWKLGELEDE
jgi:hypothetical protein